MRHDLSLAVALHRTRGRNWGAVALKAVFGAHDSLEGYIAGVALRAALAAFLLIPGRYLIVMAWPSAAAFLGFGS